MICVAAALSAAAASAREKADLLPLPVKMAQRHGVFTVDRQTVICADASAMDLAAYLNGWLGAWIGHPLETASPASDGLPGPGEERIRLSINPALACPDDSRLLMPADGYTVTVTPHGAEITGVDRGGLFYGVQTFLQLLPPEIYARKMRHDKLKAGCVEISDYPCFPYRGMMLDVARTFTPAEGVKKFIDRLAFHKINRFHWHLTDDEGWRIEIKSYPDLTAKGAFRGPDLPLKPIYGAWNRVYGGYYTQQEIREIVEYAAFHNIEIIPEIELPGHSRAAARAYPEILCTGKHDVSASAGYDRREVWCVAREENYAMLSAVLSEVCALFPSEYIHIGGDEVSKGQWRACPRCKALAGDADALMDIFTGRLTEILAANGKKPAVWNEAAASGKMPRATTRVHGWENMRAARNAALMGYPTVVMPGDYFYFDMRQIASEPGQVWACVFTADRTHSLDFEAMGFTPEAMRNVIGVEGSFFSEIYLSQDNEDYLYYQCYPRICALAEVGWRRPGSRDTDDFNSRLYGVHADRMAAMGITYRLPPPAAVYDGQAIETAERCGYTAIRYTADLSQPGEDSPSYRHRLSAKDGDISKYLFRAWRDDAKSVAVVPAITTEAHLDAYGAASIEIPMPAPGLWYLRLGQPRGEASITSLAVTAADTSYYIIRNGQRINPLHNMRIYSTERTTGGVITLSMSNDSALPTDIGVSLERSPYIEPEVTITSSMPQDPRSPFARAADYNFTSYGRTSRTCLPGDNVTYTFAAPVECRSIDIRTGFYHMPRYLMPFGGVEISADGRTFTPAGELRDGRAVIIPSGPVKAVRITSSVSGNGESNVILQDLKILPLEDER